MAKKARGFSMAAQIRMLLRRSPRLTGKEVFTRLTKRFPNQNIKASSCGVAFSNARKALRIGQDDNKGDKPPRKKTRKKIVRRKRPTRASIDLQSLQAAAKFLADVGDADKAIAAIKHVQALQIN